MEHNIGDAYVSPSYDDREIIPFSQRTTRGLADSAFLVGKYGLWLDESHLLLLLFTVDEAVRMNDGFHLRGLLFPYLSLLVYEQGFVDQRSRRRVTGGDQQRSEASEEDRQ